MKKPTAHETCSYIDLSGCIWANQDIFIYRLYNKSIYLPLKNDIGIHLGRLALVNITFSVR